MKKIVLGIPSYNEAETIENVTKNIDEGAAVFLGKYEVILVNADNDSLDNTREIFLKTKTSYKKLSIRVRDRGKGRNIFALLNYCKQVAADCLIVFDADLKSITPDWVRILSDPITRDKKDFVVPLYKRGYFEGSTTNHFASPLVAAVSNSPIRQPIGGEFGLSRNFISLLLSTKDVPRTAHGYGIDIFLTLKALSNKLSVEEVFLGEKVHKPNFKSVVNMFLEVAETAYSELARTKEFASSKFVQTSIGHPYYYMGQAKPSSELLKQVLTETRGTYHKYLPEINAILATDNMLPVPELVFTYEQPTYITKELWTDILNKMISSSANHNNSAGLLARATLPFFILRVISFWSEVSDSPPLFVSSELSTQTKLLKNKLKHIY